MGVIHSNGPLHVTRHLHERSFSNYIIWAELSADLEVRKPTEHNPKVMGCSHVGAAEWTWPHDGPGPPGPGRRGIDQVRMPVPALMTVKPKQSHRP